MSEMKHGHPQDYANQCAICNPPAPISAEEFDRKFDNGESVIEHLEPGTHLFIDSEGRCKASDVYAAIAVDASNPQNGISNGIRRASE